MYLTLSNKQKIPAIGFGTSPVTLVHEELEQAINTALEAGYRLIDTAYVYGNEKIIGNVLQSWFKSGKLKREEIFITTKLPFGRTLPEMVETFLEESLSNLQVDYIDLYLIHFPVGFTFEADLRTVVKDENGFVILNKKTDHEALWKKMEEQVDANRIKNIGLSNYNQSQIETILKFARIKPSCLEIELNIYLQQRPLVDYCHKNDIIAIVFSPLGTPDYNQRMKARNRRFYKEIQLPALFDDPLVKEIGLKHRKTPAQVLLRFLVQIGIVPIPKSMNTERIKENFNVFNFELDKEEIEVLKSLDVGENARLFKFNHIFKGIEDHPDYPFGEQ